MLKVRQLCEGISLFRSTLGAKKGLERVFLLIRMEFDKLLSFYCVYEICGLKFMGTFFCTFNRKRPKGPFDLLLFFIERDELDIYNIPIAEITNDFLVGVF